MWFKRSKTKKECFRYFVGNGYACFKKNWSYTSNGKGGASVPTEDNIVFLDQFSGNCRLGFPWWYRLWVYITTGKKPKPWKFKSLFTYSYGLTQSTKKGTVIWRSGRIFYTYEPHSFGGTLTIESDLTISGEFILGRTIKFH